jgi:hypothetical protein
MLFLHGEEGREGTNRIEGGPGKFAILLGVFLFLTATPEILRGRGDPRVQLSIKKAVSGSVSSPSNCST